MRWSYAGLAAVALVDLAAAASWSHLARHRDVNAVIEASERRRNSSMALLGARQAGSAECGADGGGKKCSGNLCCSEYGFCGDSIDYCLLKIGCQPNFGACGWPNPSGGSGPSTSAPAPTPTSTPTPTPTPTPTTTSTPVVTPTPTPSTTSTTTRTTVSPSSSTSTTAVIPSPSGGLIITTNGMCGNRTTCIGSSYGACCSEFFWCGNGDDFCGNGCKSQFGRCFGGGGGGGSSSNTPSSTPTSTPSSTPTSSPTTSISTPTPTPEPPTSTAPSPTPSPSSSSPAPGRPSSTPKPGQTPSNDGSCGGTKSCSGTTFGRCCSQFGYCGDGDQFCRPIVGCQPDFGECDTRN